MSIPQWAKEHQERFNKNDDEVPEGYVVYNEKEKEHGRPYTPHGTFKVLEAKGLLHTSKKYKKPTNPAPKGTMPGYTGYVRGKQHVFGRSYGATTRIMKETKIEHSITNAPVPLGPQYEVPTLPSTRKEKVEEAQHKAYHVPGFSLAPKDGCKKEATTNLEQLNNGALLSSRRMANHTLSSNPIPGQSNYSSPRKVIPANLKHLQYITK
eukprot:CAMPEP_0170177292 /NCGR_PEP_ID=MMETSP0040_2-20121228/9971_1 /TAXON_ID=641309 /ORGANISM="Lotharella oceanica, Strain CCMP622" /LENGTH=208 /DNA_ID=CAMNT_0010419885 /DNA_START=69 /DNA_END=695 /DNA_ORIENTATION=-